MSAIISAFGAAYAGEAQANAYEANAQQEIIQGNQERNIAITKAQQQGTANLRQRGAIRAAYGAAGVVPDRRHAAGSDERPGHPRRSGAPVRAVAGPGISNNPPVSRRRPIAPKVRRRARQVISAPLAV
jgi:hypothetical protein